MTYLLGQHRLTAALSVRVLPRGLFRFTLGPLFDGGDHAFRLEDGSPFILVFGPKVDTLDFPRVTIKEPDCLEFS